MCFIILAPCKLSPLVRPLYYGTLTVIDSTSRLIWVFRFSGCLVCWSSRSVSHVSSSVLASPIPGVRRPLLPPTASLHRVDQVDEDSMKSLVGRGRMKPVEPRCVVGLLGRWLSRRSMCLSMSAFNHQTWLNSRIWDFAGEKRLKSMVLLYLLLYGCESKPGARNSPW